MVVRKKVTGWVGWVYFAAAMILVLGGVHVIAGLTGIFSPDYYVATQTGKVLAFSYNTWGWIHLVLGAGMIALAVALMAGKFWAQIVTVALVAAGMVVDLAFIGVYPFWAIISLVISGLVLYAITLHGDELKQ